jgi:AcrR family transcriptional regulator
LKFKFTSYKIYGVNYLEGAVPRPKLTEEEKAAMRERILDAAIHILHDHGPGGLSIRAIAEEVGVSHMVLYTYFENRGELFAAMRHRQSQKMRERQERFLARARSGSIQEVMREVLNDYIQFGQRSPRRFRFMWCAMLEEADHALKPAREGHRQELHYLASLIQLGIDRGEFGVTDPLVAAFVVLGQVTGTQILLLLPDTFDVNKKERIQMEMIDAAMAYLTHQRK